MIYVYPEVDGGNELGHSETSQVNQSKFDFTALTLLVTIAVNNIFGGLKEHWFHFPQFELNV